MTIFVVSGGKFVISCFWRWSDMSELNIDGTETTKRNNDFLTVPWAFVSVVIIIVSWKNLTDFTDRDAYEKLKKENDALTCYIIVYKSHFF